MALVKPQFEAGREKVPKTGVVREPAVHREVLETVLRFAQQNGFALRGLTFSPIKGGEGNIEFLAYLQKSIQGVIPEPELDALIRAVVQESQSMQDSSQG